jgi:anti-sigma factor RsiW
MVAIMLLKYLKYRYVKARLAAYLDGELPAKTRRFIARQIDENPLAYQEYIRARQTKQSLERALPSFGKPESGQLNAVWANIQREMQKEERPPRNRRLRPQYSFGYGFAVVLIALLMIAPFAFDAQRVSASSVPSQPSPELQTTSPAITEAQATAVAFVGDAKVTDDLRSNLQNTPEASLTGKNQ